jgi:hypothetical protein
MTMKTALDTLVAKLENELSNPDMTPPPWLLRKIGIQMGVVTHDRETRMALLETLYNRPFTSSKELTFAEALAYSKFGEQPAFVQYLKGLTHEQLDF